MIIKKYKYSIEELIKKARVKFDWNIDFIQLGTQFVQALELKDYPNLIEPIKESDWQNFFAEEAKKFKKNRSFPHSHLV